MSKRFASACACLLAVASSAGCGSDFAPYNRLTSLRVLAIQSEPPRPALGDTAHFSPLLYIPEGETATLEWSWCPRTGDADDGHPCVVTEEQFRSELDPRSESVPSFDLGSGQTASFEHQFEPSSLEALCRGEPIGGILREPPDCEHGFPVSLRLVARTATDEVTAVRTVRLRFDDAHADNRNPTLAGLSADVNGETVMLDDQAGVTLPRKEETRLEVVLAEDQAEPSTETEGAENPERERLVFTWFVEAGDTEFERTSFLDGVVSLADAVQNRWEPPGRGDYPTGQSRLIVVARDDRGGVGWATARVRLGDGP